MLAIALTLSILILLLYFVVGGLIGWMVSKHVIENRPINLHPEMFDAQGNIIPDEVLAIRFEEGFFDSEEEYEE